MDNLKKGFGNSNQKKHTSTYWIACYSFDNEDEPIYVTKKVIDYVPGQDVERLMLLHCKTMLLETPEAWEVLVHQGPNEVPDSGEQIVARLSRAPFDQCKELIV